MNEYVKEQECDEGGEVQNDRRQKIYGERKVMEDEESEK